MAAGPDGPAVGPGHGRGPDRQGGLHLTSGVREVLHNFNDDGFDSLVPKYSGGRPPTFTLPERREIKKIALSRPVDHNLPFSTWSLSKLAEFLVAEGVVDDISHEGLHVLLPRGGCLLSSDQDLEAEQRPGLRGQEEPGAQALRNSGVGRPNPERGNPTVVLCSDEFGAAQPAAHQPGKQWAPMAIKGGGNTQSPRQPSPTSHLPPPRKGSEHLMAAYDLNKDKIYEHVKMKKDHTSFLEFCRYLRTLYPPTSGSPS